jgi:predicted aspartyl protease
MNPWRLAARLHDCDQLRTLFASTQADLLRRDARLHCIAALDLYWTCGLQAAASELEAACGGPGLPARHRLRRQCCALAELARHSAGVVGAVTVHGTASIPLAGSRTFPVIRASVNGLPEDSFILDTGASTSVLTRSYCDRHGIPYLKDCPFPVTDSAGNEIEAYPALVDRIEIANVIVRNWAVNVIELSPKIQVAGIVSPLETFRGMAVELDMRSREFRLHLQPVPADWLAGEQVRTTPLAWDEGKSFVQATIDGKAEGWFLLDSGAAGNSITPGFARALGIDPAASQPFASVTAGGVGQATVGPVVSVAVGDSRPARLEFFIMEPVPDDPDAEEPLVSSGFLGVPWMNNRKLLWPPDRRSLLFTEPSSDSWNPVQRL